MLELNGVNVHYGMSQALFGVDLTLQAGEVVSLLGRNGMGKTTTLHAIMGMVPISAGSIHFDGQEITGNPSFKIANLGIGLVPEGRQIFPNLTVTENLIATASNHLNHPNPWMVEHIWSLFPELAGRSELMGNLLSGGEQQMLAIGRALMTNPKLLILDEATEGLAPLIRQKIWDALTKIRGLGLSILIVDKNLKDLIALADRHYIIQRGKIEWSGTSKLFEEKTDLHHRYLGV